MSSSSPYSTDSPCALRVCLPLIDTRGLPPQGKPALCLKKASRSPQPLCLRVCAGHIVQDAGLERNLSGDARGT